MAQEAAAELTLYLVMLTKGVAIDLARSDWKGTIHWKDIP